MRSDSVCLYVDVRNFYSQNLAYFEQSNRDFFGERSCKVCFGISDIDKINTVRSVI